MEDDWIQEMKIMMKEEIKIDEYTLKKAVHDELKKIKREINSSNLQIDYIERNLKRRNVEISGVSFVKNANVVDLAVNVMTKVDSQLSEEDIESAKKKNKEK